MKAVALVGELSLSIALLRGHSHRSKQNAFALVVWRLWACPCIAQGAARSVTLGFYSLEDVA